MNTLEFLQSVLPDEGIYYLVIFVDTGAKKHLAFTDLQAMARAVTQMDKDERITAVYHACATYQHPELEQERDGKFKKVYRVDSNWNRAKAFWIDLDVGAEKAAKAAGYLDREAAQSAVSDFCGAIGWPAPTLISSGSGVHAYWTLTKTVSSTTWVPMARLLKAALTHAGVLADPTRTADFASILRPVGSTNRKGGEARPVELISQGEPADPRELAYALKEYQHATGVTASKVFAKPAYLGASDVNSDLVAHLPQYPDTPTYAAEVASNCAQMGHMRDTGGDNSYESWRLLIGVLKHCKDGEELAEEWSARRGENHDSVDWRTRFETWNAGPSTCAALEAACPSLCSQCPAKGKVTSPVQLGRRLEVAPAVALEVKVDESDVLVQMEAPLLPLAYKWDERTRSLTRMVPDKDGNPHERPFCKSFFYPFSRIVSEDGSNRFGIRVHLEDKRVKDFDVPYENMASATDLLKSLGKYGEIMSGNEKDATVNMTAYLKDALEKLKNEVGQVSTMSNFGWKDDMKSFLIGDRLYMNDGSVRKVILGGYAHSKAAPFTKMKGTAPGYGKALDFIYNRPGMESMQYALASGWGSILTPFGDDLYRGVAVSLYSGQSGTGKSTVCYNSLYAFGDALHMSLKSEQGFTELALWARMGTHNNLPLLLDEMTKVPADTLSRIVYRISLGEERERLKSGGGGTKFAENSTWAMAPFLTANTDLHALLASNLANSEAEGVRVVQLHMDEYNLPVHQGEELKRFHAACEDIRENMGAGGHEIIKYCVQHVAEIRQRVRERMTALLEHIPETKFRFYRSHAACTLVMAEITRDLGLHHFDVPALERFAITLMKGLSQTVNTSTVATPEEAYTSMVTSLLSRIIVSYEYRDARNPNGPEQPLRPIIGDAVGRFVVGNKAEPVFAGRLWLAYKDVREWCLKNRVDFPHLVRFLTDRGALNAERDKASITRGTTLPAINAQCLEIDTTKLGLEVPLAAAETTTAVRAVQSRRQ